MRFNDSLMDFWCMRCDFLRFLGKLWKEMSFCVCKEFLLGKSLTRERSYHFGSIQWI